MTCLIKIAVTLAMLFTLIPAAVYGQSMVLAQAAGTATESLMAALKGKVPSDIQLLEDLALTKPGTGVPPQLSALSGAWSVKLYSERNGSFQADFVYVFEKVASDSVTIVSMGIGRDPGSRSGGGGNMGTIWSTRYEDLRPIRVTPLEMKNTRGTLYTFELNPDGTLKVRTVGSGSPWSGTARKIAP